MGSIDAYESAKGRRYRVRWRDPEHQQREKRGFRTKREAELYNATVEVAMMKGTYFEASQSKITVGEGQVPWSGVTVS